MVKTATTSVILVTLLICSQVYGRHIINKRESTWERFQNWGSGALETVRNTASDGYNRLSDTVSQGVDSIRDRYDGSDFQKAVNSASDQANKVVDRIRSSVSRDSEED